MREIKFRAWDKKNKKWLLGYEYPSLGGFSLTGECVLFGEFAGLFHPFTRLNEIEITQYTGLKDKNGKEIYEGDILLHDLWGKSKIIWEHGMFRGVSDNHDTLADHQLQRSRIIGNIYENPELLSLKPNGEPRDNEKEHRK